MKTSFLRLLPVFFVLFAASTAFPQTGGRTKSSAPSASGAVAQHIKNTAAYAEVLVKKVELEAELADLLTAYTEEFPKVIETRHRLELIKKIFDKLAKINPTDSAKLTEAVGKLLVRKIDVDTALWKLRRQYSEDHPDVLRAKKKAEIFDKALAELLP